MLALLLALVAIPADTCRFDLPGQARQNEDATMQVIPLYDQAAADSLGLYAGWLFLAPGTQVPETQHDAEEMLWVVCGGARLRIGDQESALSQGVSVRIPKGARHAALAGAEGMVAVLIYRPGTPGKRFYDWRKVKPPPP
jgi:mannose-6-phosphate isomerase-like protein (cupin superfamily)